jgi:hypothetical protein
MNSALVFQLIEQGLALLPTLITTGVNVYERIEQLKDLASRGAAGTVTDDEIAKIRAQFDADLDEFNKPMD